MRYGVEITVDNDNAPGLLERLRAAGLTTDTGFHPRHCECVPHERDHNHFHATIDHGGVVGEFVSRILDSESLEDEFLIARMEYALKSGDPASDVNVHVHVECAPELFGAVTNIVAGARDTIAEGLSKWLGFEWDRGVGEQSQLRVVKNAVTSETRWLRHPTKPFTAHPDYPFFEWLRFTELGTAEFTFWHAYAGDPHVWDAVKMSLAIVEAAEQHALTLQVRGRGSELRSEWDHVARKQS